MDLQYFDVHSHVSFPEYDHDRGAVIERMRKAGVGTITVGVDFATSKEAINFAEKNDGFYATIGLHPNNTPNEQFTGAAFAELVSNSKVVGVGECGLDYHRIEDNAALKKKRQWEEFEAQLAFAMLHKKPLMIHCRPSKGSMDAYADLADRLEAEHRQVGELLRGNIHFFVGNVALARRFYQIGFTTSFTGVLTFADEYHDVVKFAPLAMLLTETDSPYAAPVPHRGKRNEPVNVQYVVRAIARIRGEPEAAVAAQILENAKRVFAIS